MRLFLPFPPTVNNLKNPFTRPGAKFATMVPSKAAGKFWKIAVPVLQEQMRDQVMISTPVIATLTLFPPDRRRRDLSNYLKAAEDALVRAGVLTDDSLIKVGRQVWGERIRFGLAIFDLQPHEGSTTTFTTDIKRALPESLMRD